MSAVALSKKDALVLAHKVIGTADMGFMASERISRQALVEIESLHKLGQCVAPDAIAVLRTLQMRALPGQQACRRAIEQIGQTLRPIQMEERAQRRALREAQSGQVSRQGQSGG
jgi:hypothetical protein